MSWILAYGAYQVALWLWLPAIVLRLWWRGVREPAYRTRIGERFGQYAGRVPEGNYLWVHAVSLGETRAARTLIDDLLECYPAHRIVLTQMTASGLGAAEQLYGHLDRVEFAWLPYDYGFAVRRFLRRYRPQLGVIMETEIWFGLLNECRHHRVPVLLANGRLSQRSAQRYGRVAVLLRRALADLAAIAAQSQADADRFIALGAGQVHVTGNLKFDVAASQGEPHLAQQFRRRFGPRKAVLAVSTREGEEKLLIEAVLAAGGLADHALLVMVPRHPQRFGDVAELLHKADLPFIRRSSDLDVPSGIDVVLGDSLGEMQAYLHACDCAFVGGSLLPYGGQNLIEACAAGIPVLFGPHTYNFAEASEAAIAAGAALRVPDATELVRQINRLLEDQAMRQAMGKSALTFCKAHAGATARTMSLCRNLLPCR